MDPISIISLAGSAASASYTVSKNIYTFINSVKHVDETIQDLASELAGLRRTLDAMNVVLANPFVKTEKAQAPENVPIWAATAGALEDCRKSLTAMDDKMQPRHKPGANFFRRSLTVIKLNLSEDDMRSLRTRLATHTSSVQLSLQLINLLVAGIAPASAIEGVSEDIAQLSSALEDLKILETGAGGVSPATLKQIRETAQRVLDNAPEFISSGLLEVPDEDTRHQSVAALRSAVTEYNRSLYKEGESERHDSASTAGAVDGKDVDSSDSDDAMEESLSRNMFEAAGRSFASARYGEAEAYFRDGLRHVDGQPKGDSVGDLWQIRMQLALCCYHQDKLEEAELMLLVLSRSEKSVTLASLQAYHHLAKIYLCMYKFEPALEYATMAVKGRRRLLGKSHRDYRSSLDLQALVYEADGDYMTASSYREKLPDGFQDAGNEKVRALFDGYSTSPMLRLTLVDKREALLQLSQIEQGRDIIHQYRKIRRANGVKFVLNADAINMPRALTWAATNHLTLVAKWLLARGAPPDGAGGNCGPLLEAGNMGADEVARLLLECGAKTELAGSDSTPLLYAAFGGHESTAKILLSHGADPNRASNSGMTPLMEAAEEGHLSLVKVLVKAGASFTPKTHTSSTNALFKCIAKYHSEIAEYLLDQGAPGDVACLREAMERREPTIVRKLVEVGVAVNEQQPFTLLHKACGIDNDEIVRILLEAGAKVDAVDNDGQTPFARAAENRRVPNMRLLLKHGADPNLASKAGLLPGSRIKHAAFAGGNCAAFLKEFPDIKDCRSQKIDCRECSNWDKRYLDLDASQYPS